jgi:hypothetical protein
MSLSLLIDQLSTQLPGATERRLACLAMLMSDRFPTSECLADRTKFLSLLEEINLKIQSLDDQHAAVALELDSLAATEPCEFEPKHVWTLIRAIKVQSQFVDFLTGVNETALAKTN